MRRRQIARGLSRARERGVDPDAVRRERRLQPDEPPLGGSGRDGHLSVLVGHAREVVESRHRVVERLRAEHDRERVDLSLLVQVAEMLCKEALRDDERLVRGGHLLRQPALRHLQPVRLALEPGELRLGRPEARVEGVQVEQRPVRPGIERLRLDAQLGRSLVVGRSGVGGRRCRDDSGAERRSHACEPRRR